MRRVLALLPLAACGGDPAPPAPDGDLSGPWRDAPPVAGGAIQETAVVAVGAAVHVIGGFRGDLSISDEVRVFDTATETWSAGAALPAPLHHANVAVVDDTIYLVGHLAGTGFAARGDVLAGPPWTARTAMPAGTERGAAVAGVVDGRIVVAGGLRGGATVADVSAYDPGLDAWDDALPDLPAPRDHACGAAVDGIFYVIGGRAGGAIAADVFAFDGAAWTTRAPMPTARAGMACGVVDGRVIVVGGEGNPAASSGVFPEAEAYDPATDTWTALDPMPTPRHGMGAAAVGATLYVPGGATQQGFGAVDTHEALTP